MKVAVVKERRAYERRVAASPDSVKRMAAWASMSWSRAARARALFTDLALAAAGASIAADEAAALADADIAAQGAAAVVARRGGELDELHTDKARRGADRAVAAAGKPRRYRGLRQGRDRRFCDGAGAAHHPRAGDGRAVVAGQPRRLQGGDRCRRRIRSRVADDDDRGRHDQGGAGAGDGGGGRRAAGDRHRPAAWRDRRPRPMCAPRPRSRSRASARRLSRSTRRRRARAETAGGYAREMGEDYQRRQREKITEALRRTDIVICTALIPGRRAPVLLTEAMVAEMAPGSVIVDLAVEAGGNVEGSQARRGRRPPPTGSRSSASQHAVAHRRRCQPALCPQSIGLSRAARRQGEASCASTPRTRSSRPRC